MWNCWKSDHTVKASSHLLPIQRVQPLHGPGVQLDGLCDVGQHLFEGVSRLLVQQDPHRLARLHAAADHRHQFGLDKVFVLPALTGFRAFFGGAGGARRHPRGRRGGPARARAAWPGAGTWLPAWDGDLGVVDLSVRLVGGTNVALTWAERGQEEEKEEEKLDYCISKKYSKKFKEVKCCNKRDQ